MNANPSRYFLDTPPADVSTAMLIAIGIVLPANEPENWPVGMKDAWREAETAGAFSGTRMIGDLARAFLGHKLARLNRTIGAVS